MQHERSLDGRSKTLHHLNHLVALIRPFRQRDAYIQEVGPALHLVARNAEHAVVLVGEQQPLHFPTALGVDTLPNERWWRVLAQIEGADRACCAGASFGNDSAARRTVAESLDHGAQVIGCRAAA